MRRRTAPQFARIDHLTLLSGLLHATFKNLSVLVSPRLTFSNVSRICCLRVWPKSENLECVICLHDLFHEFNRCLTDSPYFGLISKGAVRGLCCDDFTKTILWSYVVGCLHKCSAIEQRWCLHEQLLGPHKHSRVRYDLISRVEKTRIFKFSMLVITHGSNVTLI